jgi:hypothetical protein
VCLAVIGAVITPAFVFLPFTLQSLLFPVLGFGAVAAILGGQALHRPPRPAPWLLLAAGVLLWTLGDVAYSAYELLQDEVPFPSVADGLYLAGYLVVAGGLGLAVRRSGVRDAVAWQDAGICVVGATLLAWDWLLEPVRTRCWPSSSPSRTRPSTWSCC